MVVMVMVMSAWGGLWLSCWLAKLRSWYQDDDIYNTAGCCLPGVVDDT
jgi:hypothetical protein